MRASRPDRSRCPQSCLPRSGADPAAAFLAGVLLLSSAACGQGASTGAVTPDRILHNGQVVTVDDDFS
ncbi:MAG: hypothetical protein OXN18_04180, partial [Gemmatimonadota bacterium]|nr:hypothetical protein [Gemmatimonadota bacterium]